MSRLCLYYVPEPEQDRWVRGDHRVRPLLRRMLRGRPRMSGVDKVFSNLCLGLDRLAIPYHVNLPFAQLRPEDRVGVLGRGRHCLQGYDRSNAIVAGVALMTHPSEWPTLCDDYPVARYIQHSEWAAAVYRPYFGSRVAIWPVGIDTDAWIPSAEPKTFDFLVYDKIRWNRDSLGAEMLSTVRDTLRSRNVSSCELTYGDYSEDQFRQCLHASRAMIFLAEHESQGLACQECLSSDVPVLAWDPGECLDPARFAWGQPRIPATSVPYFDERCGLRFAGPGSFTPTLDDFLDRLRGGRFMPRDYVLEHLSLDRCAARYVDLFDGIGVAA